MGGRGVCLPSRKRCGKCGLVKAWGGFVRDTNSKDGLAWSCKSCKNAYNRSAYSDPSHPAHNRLQMSARTANIRRANPNDPFYWRGRESRWRRLGIENPDGSPFLRADYDRLMKEQDSKCLICGLRFERPRRVNVDHWHRRGKYGPARALLCWKCNRRIGDLTWESVQPIYTYLHRFAPQVTPPTIHAETPKTGSGILLEPISSTFSR